MNTLTNALWITLVGMGLVFVAIVLLWGLMAAMVRLIKDKPEPGAAGPSETTEEVTSQEDEYQPERRLKMQAAAAAVAAALAGEQTKAGQAAAALADGMRATGVWQVVNRATQLNMKINPQKKKVSR